MMNKNFHLILVILENHDREAEMGWEDAYGDEMKDRFITHNRTSIFIYQFWIVNHFFFKDSGTNKLLRT